MKLLFWNINNKSLTNEVAELILESNCDICAFAEMGDETYKGIINNLQESNNIDCYPYPTPGCDRIKIIIAGQVDEISLLNQHKYYSLIKVRKNEHEFILGFVHFPSKFHHSLDELRRASETLCDQIIFEEKMHSIADSIIIGDFNVDPFEMPMVSFSGMGATNGLACSNREEVTRGGEKTRLFYNPMWTLYSLYKDRPGTHRYSRLGEDVVSWHFLDQVVIRPTLIDNFQLESLKMVKGTENYNYLNNNQTPVMSDHLPLSCELMI